MSLLTDVPLDWTNTSLQQLRDTLVQAYFDNNNTRNIVQEAGFNMGEYPVGLMNIGDIWRELMNKLAVQGKLRILLNTALADSDAAGYHAFYAWILAEDSKDRPHGLTVDERKQLRAAYQQAFATRTQFESLLQTGLNRAPGDFQGSSIGESIDALIDSYESQAGIAQLFAAPGKIVDHEDPSQLTLSQIVIKMVRDHYEERMKEPARQDLFERCILDPDIPFVNRRTFRDYTRTLNNDNARPILLVNGEPGVGKTHSRCFLSLIAGSPHIRLCYIELASEPKRKSYHADELVMKIDTDLTLPPHPDHPALPEQQEVKERWGEVLSPWLFKKMLLPPLKQGGIAPPPDMKYWIALDGFAHDDLPTETQHVLEDLILAVYERALPRVRLILLDFSRERLREFHRDIFDDMGQEEYIEVVDQAELKCYLQNVIKEMKLEVVTEVSEEMLNQKAHEIITCLDGKPKEEHMREIKKRVRQAPMELVK